MTFRNMVRWARVAARVARALFEAIEKLFKPAPDDPSDEEE